MRPGNRWIDRTGQRFGRLTAVEWLGRVGGWRCICDCGTETAVRSDHLRRGLTRSCGCLQRELISARAKRHGEAVGGVLTTEYAIWRGIKQRTGNPSCTAYPDYGGRGISLCERWRDFQNFLADMGRRPSKEHSIDRINNDGNYEPGNCRWATRLEQARNRRPRRDGKKSRAA